MNIRTILLTSIACLSLVAADVADAKGGRSGGGRSSSRSAAATAKPRPHQPKPWKPYRSTITTQHRPGVYVLPHGHSESEEQEDCDIEDWFEGDADCAGLSGPNAF